MATRPMEGTALLVAGHGAIGGDLDASAVHTLGQIGEALLATGAGWQIRRLVATPGERFGADRATLKRQLDELVAEPVRAAVVVVVGNIAGDALVTGDNHRTYPDDATLRLDWIAARLRTARAGQLVVVLSARGDGDPTTWLAALATGRAGDVVAVDAPTAGAPLADALLAGLCGDALDPRTGTVTMRSLGEQLARAVPTAAIRGSLASHTLTQPPPLGGLWDVRRSQLSATRPRRPRAATDAADDLAGAVLPGRFRVDALIARGTFGTVYRAHQLAVERDVAIKVLNADIDPASEDGRLFVHEIRSVGRIDHANVVRIYQADITHDGRLFFAMELLAGRDLQAVVGDGTVEQARAIGLVCQLLAGLGAAHDAGLVHADVKPANAIVVARDGGERVVLVDFGLARLRPVDRPAESAGGTPAYMAPEQLHDGRVDARSDLFSAALVLVTLLTGWRRPNAQALVPPLDRIVDPALRAVLERALATDPGARYPGARELAAALVGGPASAAVMQPVPVLPFRQFARLTEADRDRLHGREADIAALVEHVLYRRAVIYTAPSGVGKTSLLRAGLVPRLEALGLAVLYWRCRDGAELAPLQAALAERRVIVLDQLEASIDVLDLVLPRAEHVVLSIREDHLARVVGRAQALEPGIPIVRLPPLDRDGARAAIVGPLAAARLAIEPALLDALLADLARAASALAPGLGWSASAAAYPPHLQLACSVLYDALGAGEATLTLAHYRRLGGFDAIVGEHLERVLDVELAGGRGAIARDLFVALVTATHERAMRGEAELLAIVHDDRAHEVLELLRARGLLVRVRAGDEPSWELVHDSLVPRVLAWIDRRDLARRRAIELVRYHVRRSLRDAPSLLGRAELRELRPHAAAVAALDAELADRAWPPSRLVARSRAVLRRRALALAAVAVAALAVTGVAVVRSRRADARERREASLRERDLGRFVLELAPFDWDAAALRATPVRAAALPDLRWELHYPSREDADAPGDVFGDDHVVRGARTIGDTLAEHVEAHGGRAFLVVAGRGRAGERCAPAIVPVLAVPGYATRERDEPTLRIRVPTCAATLADTIEIPAGPFIFGGAGEPPSEDAAKYRAVEQRIELASYRIDRTEVTNAAFAQFAAMASITGVAMPSYPATPELAEAGAPGVPVTDITWSEARALCRFLGKELPTSQEWEKAMRGGTRLADGSPNPMPRRNLPWGAPIDPVPARLLPADRGRISALPVGSVAGDRSPYGVVDLAGNVMEWTESLTAERDRGVRIARGGDVFETGAAELAEYEAIENPRSATYRFFGLGARCAVRGELR